MKIYLKGQETTDSYDKFDHEMCGEKKQPFVVVSDGPRLVMVFSSGELQGRGFKANYTFETGMYVYYKFIPLIVGVFFHLNDIFVNTFCLDMHLFAL